MDAVLPGGLPAPPAVADQVFGSQLPLAQRFAELLATDGISRGLIGPREVPRLWERHLVNCALTTDALPSRDAADSVRVVDVGSGAGLPGLVMAIRRPDVSVDLVEPMERRCVFLRDAVDELGLGDHVRVVRGRADDRDVIEAVGEARWVTARAVAPLDRLVRWCVPLLVPGGALLAMKGSSAAEEIAQHHSELSRLGVVDVRVERYQAGDESITVVRAVRGDRAGQPTHRSTRRAQRKGR